MTPPEIIDEELEQKALEALRVAAALILQAGADGATERLAASPEGRLAQAARVEAAGRDAALLAGACGVLIRWGSGG